MRGDSKKHSWVTNEIASAGLSESLASGANDIVVVRQSNGQLAATPVQLQIGKTQNEKVLYIPTRKQVLGSLFERCIFLFFYNKCWPSYGEHLFDHHLWSLFQSSLLY